MAFELPAPAPLPRIFIGLPDQKARLSILNVVLGGERLAPNADLARVAEQTDGYSGSDLKQVCVQAAMRPVRAFLERDSAVAAANAAPEGQEEEEAEVAGMAPPQAAAPAGGIGAGEPAAGIPGLPMVPRLDSLLRQAKRIASAPANPKTDLRPISMQARAAGRGGGGAQGRCSDLCAHVSLY